MAEEPICRDYQWLADILTQSDNVTRATTPTTDTVNAADASEDTGKKFADEIFTPGKRVTPAKLIGYTDRFDTNQAANRIMKLYKLCRADYFEQAVEDNDKRRARLDYKANYTEKLLQQDRQVDEELEKAIKSHRKLLNSNVG